MHPSYLSYILFQMENMLNAYRPDWAGKCVRLDINYQREVKMGKPLDTYYLVQPDGVQYIQKNEAGENACSAKITISDNTDC